MLYEVTASGVYQDFNYDVVNANRCLRERDNTDTDTDIRAQTKPDFAVIKLFETKREN